MRHIAPDAGAAILGNLQTSSRHHVLHLFTSCGREVVADVYEAILRELVNLADGEYGFIGEVLYSEANTPYLRKLAITDVAWDEPTRKMYAQASGRGMEFRNLDTRRPTACRFSRFSSI